jgi:hypothetical protein
VSFDLFLQHFRAGASAEADRVSVKRVICQTRIVVPDEYGQYDVPLSDGGYIRLSASTLEGEEMFDGCAFHLRDFSPEYCDFILRLAVAGDMVIFNAQGKDDPDNPVLIFTDEAQALHVPADMYKHSVVARNELHLYALLDGTYEGWERYRAQVVPAPPRQNDA